MKSDRITKISNPAIRLVAWPVNQAVHVYEVLTMKRKYEGGEGVERLIRQRKPDHKSKRILKDDDYWITTLVALHGRAFPVKPVIIYLLYCSAICAAVIYGMTEEQKRGLAPLNSIQALLGALLGLLMAFRLNQSYNRWWEGRKAWEIVRNGCANIARHAHAHIASKDGELARKLVAYAWVFPRVLKCHLHNSKELRCRGELSTDEELEIADSVHMPLFVLGKMSELCAELVAQGMSEGKMMVMFEKHVEMLNTAVTAAHTVATTPVPFAYVTHLRTIVVMFLMCVPFVYALSYNWYCLIVCGFIGFAWFGLETTSVEIESPFGVDYNDLPLNAYNADIYRIMSVWPRVAPESHPEPTAIKISHPSSRFEGIMIGQQQSDTPMSSTLESVATEQSLGRDGSGVGTCRLGSGVSGMIRNGSSTLGDGKRVDSRALSARNDSIGGVMIGGGGVISGEGVCRQDSRRVVSVKSGGVTVLIGRNDSAGIGRKDSKQRGRDGSIAIGPFSGEDGGDGADRPCALSVITSCGTENV